MYSLTLCSVRLSVAARVYALGFSYLHNTAVDNTSISPPKFNIHSPEF